MTGHRRVLRATTAVVLVAASVLVGTASPTGAFVRERYVLEQGGGARKNYPAFTSSYPGHQAESSPAKERSTTPTPEQCGNTGPLATSCDVVPLRIVRPNIGKNDDFVVTIRVNWAASPGDTDDIDVFMYDDGQNAGGDGTTKTYTRVATAASSARPETIKILSPDLADFNLVVVHFSGVNNGYNVSGSISTDNITPPSELLAESGGRPPVDTSADTAGPSEALPPDFSADAPAAFSNPDDFAPDAVALPEVAILPDADLDVGSGSGFQSEFAAPIARGRGDGGPIDRGKPVPAPVVLFWFLVVPAALVGGAYMLAVRRNRTAFSFG